MPGIVVGLAFVTVSIRVAPGFYQTTVLLIAAYVLLFLPRALVNIRAGLAQAPKELDEAAQALGKPPLVSHAAAHGARRGRRGRPRIPCHRQ
jgi:iron(III) transport system permease protein